MAPAETMAPAESNAGALPPPLPVLPDWSVARWFNAAGPLSLADFRGRVVMLHSFQMLCPGCVAQALPQAQMVQNELAGDDLAVVGLHTVFEHHEAMGPPALAAFIHEYRLTFPIGIDRPQKDSPLPETMARYGLRGTPSLLLVDRRGRLRHHHFGRLADLHLGVLLSRLIAEDPNQNEPDQNDPKQNDPLSPQTAMSSDPAPGPGGCDTGVCPS
ncbi:TlpA disulfide reductase family protein [Pelagibius sp.]|uniref:TlpA disulfide reductase family protein n=1 Tax=Pelagibius sp. TaxID=1931238 RepID=UPI003B50BA6B